QRAGEAPERREKSDQRVLPGDRIPLSGPHPLLPTERKEAGERPPVASLSASPLPARAHTRWRWNAASDGLAVRCLATRRRAMRALASRRPGAVLQAGLQSPSMRTRLLTPVVLCSSLLLPLLGGCGADTRDPDATWRC